MTKTKRSTPRSSAASCTGLGLRRDGGRHRLPRALAAGVAADTRTLCLRCRRRKADRSPRRPRPGRSIRTSSAPRRSRPRARSPARTSTPKKRGRELPSQLGPRHASGRRPPAARPPSRRRIRPRPAAGRSSAQELLHVRRPDGQEGGIRDLHRRAAARQPDRAAAADTARRRPASRTASASAKPEAINPMDTDADAGQVRRLAERRSRNPCLLTRCCPRRCMRDADAE